MENANIPPQPPAGLPPLLPTQTSQDASHLKILSICYYVMSGLTVLGVFVCGIYIFMGFAMMGGFLESGGASSNSAFEERMMGGVFLVIGILGMLFLGVTAVLEFMVARRIVRCKSRILCMIVAGLNCLNMPMGTVLGIFTFIVMSRPSIAEKFTRNEGKL